MNFLVIPQVICGECFDVMLVEWPYPHKLHTPEWYCVNPECPQYKQILHYLEVHHPNP